ncbi:MAG: hypothetical protein KC636_07810 [Myxococcales bacterium]|nr:hypothetical protein [Myxococcales bacterium]
MRFKLTPPSLLPLALALAAGCGPTPSATTDDASGSSDGGSETTDATSDDASTADPSVTTSAPGTTSDASTAPTSDPATTDPGTTTDPSSDTDCNFLCPTDTTCGLVETPDGLQPRCTLECDLWSQDCPEGDKCVPWDSDGDHAWDATRCVTVEGDGVVGDPCVAEGLSGVDSCAFGHVCWYIDPDTGEGTCLAQCTGEPDAPLCAPDQICLVANDGVLNLCFPACDPINPTCLEGQACQVAPFGDGFLCVPTAETPGGVGEPCEFENCDPGLACLGYDYFPHPACEDAAGCCAPYCDLSQGEGPANPTCAALAADIPAIGCAPYYEEGQAPPGYEDLGLCVVP